MVSAVVRHYRGSVLPFGRQSGLPPEDAGEHEPDGSRYPDCGRGAFAYELPCLLAQFFDTLLVQIVGGRLDRPRSAARVISVFLAETLVQLRRIFVDHAAQTTQSFTRLCLAFADKIARCRLRIRRHIAALGLRLRLVDTGTVACFGAKCSGACFRFVKRGGKT